MAPNGKRLVDLLDSLEMKLQQQHFAEVGHCLFVDLPSLRAAHGLTLWRAELDAVRSHEVVSLVRECPFSRHASARPRGYAGDAQLLDYLYRSTSVADKVSSASALGRRLHDIFVSSPAAAAVRGRRDYFANAIDCLASYQDKPKILSVACGHLREAEASHAVMEGKAELTGIDQDGLSIAQAAGDLSCYPNVRLVQASIGRIMRAPSEFGAFDLIYAAGLYDYLTGPVAQQLAESFFQMLNPKGTLVISNFLDTCVNAASMEIFQDWQLLYRSEAEIRSIVTPLQPDLVCSTSFTTDAFRCVGYLTLVKN